MSCWSAGRRSRRAPSERWEAARRSWPAPHRCARVARRYAVNRAPQGLPYHRCRAFCSSVSSPMRAERMPIAPPAPAPNRVSCPLVSCMLRCRVKSPSRILAASRERGYTMAFYEKGPVRIHYEEAGSGFPLFVSPGGGQNSTIGFMSDRAPFNATEEFKDEYRCITADLRNAPSGQSSGPLEIDRPWDSYADDHLGLMDHLGIRRFMVIGYCIGGPFIWKLIQRAPERIVAAVVSQPVGFRRESNPMYDNSMQTWGPALIKQRPDLTMDMIDKFLTRMYVTNA